MRPPSSDHQYQAIFRDTVLFGAADQSDPKWNTPVRVTVHVPKALLPEDESGNFSSESLDQISEAPPPVVEMTKMHTNTYHSLYVNDGLVKEAVLNDGKGVSGKYKAISRDLGDSAKAYYNMVIDQALSAAGFDTNSLSSPALLPTDKAPDTADEAAQRTADNQLDRFVTNPLTGYIESFAGGQISYGVANHLIYTAVHFAQARETAPSLAKAAWSTFHASFLKPCYQGVQDMVNLARSAPHEISQGVQADRHKNAWVGYLARTAGKPQILLHELRGSGLNDDSRLHDLDPTRDRVATTLLQKGHFDGPLMEGDTGYGCEDGPMQLWLNHNNLRIDLLDLQEVQNQIRAHFHGQGVYSGYDWRFQPEHLGLDTRTNDIGVTEPGRFGNPESLDPDFFIRARQHDGHAAITDASDPVDIVCFPHPELDLAVRASLDSASLAAHYLETPEFRAKFLTDAANHIEAEAPGIADEIRAQREYNQRTLDLAHDHVYEGKLKGAELREAVIHSIAQASGIDGQTTFESAGLSMTAKSSLNQSC